jgi:periplasmic divalent cation tolerance protein
MKNDNVPVIVFIACPDRVIAMEIAEVLVEQKLAACAQLFPIQSVFRWEGEVQSEEEAMLQVKTMSAHLPELEAAVTDLHPYDVPELIATTIDWGLPAYLAWMKEVTHA